MHSNILLMSSFQWLIYHYVCSNLKVFEWIQVQYLHGWKRSHSWYYVPVRANVISKLLWWELLLQCFLLDFSVLSVFFFFPSSFYLFFSFSYHLFPRLHFVLLSEAIWIMSCNLKLIDQIKWLHPIFIRISDTLQLRCNEAVL